MSLTYFELMSAESVSFKGKPEYVTTIPTTIGMLSNVEFIVVAYFTVPGTIPTELGRLTKLNTLTLEYLQGLHGTVPLELGNLYLGKYDRVFRSSWQNIGLSNTIVTVADALTLVYNFGLNGTIDHMCGHTSYVEYDCNLECNCCKDSCNDANR